MQTTETITQAPMLAFHGDPKVKRRYLSRVRAHAKADEIVKGQYWENGRGCAVGCTIHSGKHLAYESELGIPVQIAFLEDRIFENLPNGLAMKWPERFLKAIKPGADLSLVTARFMVWLLIDEKDGVIRHAKGFANVEASINTVAALYQRLTDGGKVADAEWSAAAAAARAARSAARSAAAAAMAARAAAWAAAAESAAEAAWAAWAAEVAAAAESAWAAAAESAAAETNAYIRMADKLIELLESATLRVTA